jgi:hypothetical protein
MWRLTTEALREGVKSTTRYRSKQPNKRGARTQHPQPQRQASGAKGGQAARRSAHIKRSKRVNDHHFSSRGPAAYLARSVPEFDSTHTHTYDALMPPASYYPDIPYPTLHPKQEFGTTDMFAPAHGFADQSYVLQQSSPSEPLFTNSPSPSAGDEPRTPMSSTGGWGEEMFGLGMGEAWCEDMDRWMGYQEYAG